ncbi:MAG: thiamine diphosphokinase [Elusimicrobiota bacterium]|jgi:thiamine pyrophosphokinase|nr:thiamine diphosphokinase [Elusimicrobiota bacterium]
MKNILIIANGGREDAAFLRRMAGAHDYVLALDGGADNALAAGVMPDLALGDLDSISPAAKKKLGNLRLLQIPRQDNTDLEKGLDFTVFLKPAAISIVCATGGRIDFTLGNFSSVFAYTKKTDIVFRGKGWRVYPLEAAAKPRKFACKKGDTVSLVPAGDCGGITLKNLKYPLKNAPLAVGQTAISNVALGESFEVLLKAGRLFVIVYEK